MSDAEQTERPAGRIWTQSGFVEDEWRLAVDGAAPASGRTILKLENFLALDEAERAAHGGRLGVLVEPGEAIEPLLPHLAQVSLVALRFPAFNDGRSYSKAVLMRQRYRYDGDVRAVGEVLIDQVAHMLRCGFSSLEVSDPIAVERLEQRRVGAYALHYQSAVRHDAPAGGYGWRRRSA